MQYAVGKLLCVGALSASLIACSETSTKAAIQDDTEVSVTTVMDPVAQFSADVQADTFVQTVDSAFAVVRQVRTARLAIFHGEGPDALTYINDAIANFALARADIESLEQDGAGLSFDDGYAPFDVSMSITEDFTADADKQAAVDAANEQIKDGKRSEAVEILRLAEIEIETAVAALPIVDTAERLDNAAELLAEHKYYEANLELKAIEDGVVIQVLDIDSLSAPDNSE